MNAASLSAKLNLFGIYEMDSSGTVFYYKAHSCSLPDEPPAKLIGCSFFDENSAFQNIKDFRRHFKNFVTDSHPTEDFEFNFQSREQTLKGRVKLVRVCERQDNKSSNLIIVDIRQN